MTYVGHDAHSVLAIAAQDAILRAREREREGQCQSQAASSEVEQEKWKVPRTMAYSCAQAGTA